jgi:hypothetical protein
VKRVPVKRRYGPKEVLPPPVAKVVPSGTYWFLIGGHAVRCFAPYRPSDDVDFGVIDARSKGELLRHLRSNGTVEVRERADDTVHATFDGIDISIFVLPKLARHVQGGSLDARGILATKLHAILDRGTRRDFFDLYVMLEQHRLGISECLQALRVVYGSEVNDGLVLRAITYFDDADHEAPLPGEGRSDWKVVKAFFERAAAVLLLPPLTTLKIQGRVVDVRGSEAKASKRTTKRRM